LVQKEPYEIPVEQATDIGMLRPFFIREFYQRWCEYFSKYHGVEDYCRSMIQKEN
jgi:hypothetical protein